MVLIAMVIIAIITMLLAILSVAARGWVAQVSWAWVVAVVVVTIR